MGRAALHMVYYDNILDLVEVSEQLYILYHQLSVKDELKTGAWILKYICPPG